MQTSGKQAFLDCIKEEQAMPMLEGHLSESQRPEEDVDAAMVELPGNTLPVSDAAGKQKEALIQDSLNPEPFFLRPDSDSILQDAAPAEPARPAPITAGGTAVKQRSEGATAAKAEDAVAIEQALGTASSEPAAPLQAAGRVSLVISAPQARTSIPIKCHLPTVTLLLTCLKSLQSRLPHAAFYSSAFGGSPSLCCAENVCARACI